MRATLRSARIAPKKANLIAAMVRRRSVPAALSLLEHLPKKAAGLLKGLIASAAANAEHRAAQDRKALFVKTLVVQKGPGSRRYIPMARGRARAIDKWTSHITVELGVLVPEGGKEPKESKETKETKDVIKKDIPHEVPSAVISESKPGISPAPPLDAPHGPNKGSSRREDRGPTFQPHRRGGRGS